MTKPESAGTGRISAEGASDSCWMNFRSVPEGPFTTPTDQGPLSEVELTYAIQL